MRMRILFRFIRCMTSFRVLLWCNAKTVSHHMLLVNFSLQLLLCRLSLYPFQLLNLVVPLQCWIHVTPTYISFGYRCCRSILFHYVSNPSNCDFITMPKHTSHNIERVHQVHTQLVSLRFYCYSSSRLDLCVFVICIVVEALVSTAII